MTMPSSPISTSTGTRSRRPARADLVNFCCMVSPYGADAEKQVLLEAKPSARGPRPRRYRAGRIRQGPRRAGPPRAQLTERAGPAPDRPHQSMRYLDRPQHAGNAGLPADQDPTLPVSSDRNRASVSVAAHLAFPISYGVPMLSLDEAREFIPRKWRRSAGWGLGSKQMSQSGLPSPPVGEGGSTEGRDG